MHVPLHLAKPIEHEMSHWLPVHTAEPFCGTAHALPQPPQFPVLVAVSTQLPEQAVSAPHVVLHVLFEHDSPLPQGLSHFPQFAASLDVSTHAFPHCASIAGQKKPQAPAVHVAVADAGTLQTMSQFPQCCGSFFVSMQA